MTARTETVLPKEKMEDKSTSVTEASVEFAASMRVESEAEKSVERDVEVAVDLVDTSEPVVANVMKKTLTPDVSGASTESYLGQFDNADPVEKYTPPPPKVLASTGGLSGYLGDVGKASPLAFITTKVTKPEIDLGVLESGVEQDAETSSWSELEAQMEQVVLGKTKTKVVQMDLTNSIDVIEAEASVERVAPMQVESDAEIRMERGTEAAVNSRHTSQTVVPDAGDQPLPIPTSNAVIEETAENNRETAVERAASMRVESQTAKSVESSVESMVELMHESKPTVSEDKEQISSTSLPKTFESHLDQFGGTSPLEKYTPPATKVPVTTEDLGGVGTSSPEDFTSTKVPKVQSLETNAESSAEIAAGLRAMEAAAEKIAESRIFEPSYSFPPVKIDAQTRDEMDASRSTNSSIPPEFWSQ